MSRERWIIDPDRTVNQTFDDGTFIEVKVLQPQRPEAGSTSKHEATHAVAAGDIIRADNIPSGNALGRTWPVRMTAIAASAPAALGHSGTSWDQFLTERVLGVDWSTAKRAARSALAGKQEEIEEVAILIEERRVITQTDINEARETVSKRRKGMFPVEVTVKRPDNVPYSYKTRSFQGEIIKAKVDTEDHGRRMIERGIAPRLIVT